MPEHGESRTPMERQYSEIKGRHRDKILLFRLGDFYEMFYDDAKDAALILNLALTSRSEMPMCGFPRHAASQYIQKLINAGRKVAVCEQMEDPAKAKGLIKRDIVSIITPGTVLDDNFTSPRKNNYLCAIYKADEKTSVVFADFSTGEIFGGSSTGSLDTRFISDQIAIFSPSEIIHNEKSEAPDSEVTGALNESYPEWYFDISFLPENVISVIPGNIKKDKGLLLCLAGALHYMFDTQPQNPGAFFKSIEGPLKEVIILNKDSTMEIDDFSIRNLELVKNMQDGGQKFTLLDTIDSTVTPMGGRLLKQWLLMPLYDAEKIKCRQDYINVFFTDSIFTSKTREILKKISDLGRLSTRLYIGKIIPRDIISISNSIRSSIELKNLISDCSVMKSMYDSMPDLSSTTDMVEKAVMSEPSSVFGGDGVINSGFNDELDSLRLLMREGRDGLIRLQNEERERTGISSLKIKYNNIFGYFIEVSNSNAHLVPPDYIKKQTLSGAERYTIKKLSDYETGIASAGEKLIRIEEEIFLAIVEKVRIEIDNIRKLSDIIAMIDIYSALAVTASENNYVRPEIDTGDDFIIENGRHPVVEKYLGSNIFVPNDTMLDASDNRIIVITGPNMAGKSTYLRQNALFAIMAQTGCFLPATKAKIGIIDRIFTRIGASDNLSQGQSTFLVEMREAANIIKNSTSKSMIIMDELGRGTSTFDGLSIAWSVIEYMQEHPEKSGKTLFATHYHELTKLGEKKGIKNFSVAVREYKDELVFLRKVVPGPADRSYGIFVASLAGMETEIIERAKIILETLESEGDAAKGRIERVFDRVYRSSVTASTYSKQLELFPDNIYHGIIDRIKNIDIDKTTPVEALTFLSEIKKQL